MRTGFVMATVILALVLGIVAGVSESRLFTRALIVGFVPAVLIAARVLERLRGRHIWHFTAPYPYRWMRERGVAALPPSKRSATGKTIDKPSKPGDRSTLPMAA